MRLFNVYKVNRKGQPVEYCFKVISILIIIIIIKNKYSFLH